MAAQKSPFLGVNYGWSLGEDSWNVGMDDNLRQFSALLYKVVDGIVTDVPAMNSGQMYYSTLDNTINYNIDGITYRQVVPVGFSFTDKVTGISYKYDGNSVSPEFSQSSGDSRYVLQSSTTPFSLTLLAASTAAASRGVLGLGTASTQATGFFEPAITAGTNVQFWRGDKTFQDLGAFIRSNSLTGLSLATSTPITAADTTLSGFGKLQGQVTLKAPLASPALTGIPTAPTASAGTNTDQIATTAFVAAASASTAVSAIAPIKVKTDRTLAPSATHPVKRDDGSDLQVGDSYPNTVKNDAYFWNGAEWNSSAQQLEERIKDNTNPANGAGIIGFDGMTLGDWLVAQGYWRTVEYFGLTDTPANTRATMQLAINWCAANGYVLKAKARSYTIDVSISGITIPDNFICDFGSAWVNRATGSQTPHDMWVNADTVNGNTGISLQGVRFNGKAQVDSLTNANPAHRFCGLRLIKCEGRLSDIRADATCNGEIQAEGTRGGIMLQESVFMDCENLRTDNTIGTGLFIRGGLGRLRNFQGNNNTGSGMSGDQPGWIMNTLSSKVSGYSGISLNGPGWIANGVYASGAPIGYAGINLGHAGAGNGAVDAVASGFVAENNAGWGINATSSPGLQGDGWVSKNSGAEGIRLVNSPGSTISALVKGGSSHGLLVDGAGTYAIDANISGAAFNGLYARNGADVVLSAGSVLSGNSQGGAAATFTAGVTVDTASKVEIHGRVLDGAAYGVQSIGGGIISIEGGSVRGNASGDIRTSGGTVRFDRAKLSADMRSGTFTILAGTNNVATGNGNMIDPNLVSFTPANAAARTAGNPIVSTFVPQSSFTAQIGANAPTDAQYRYVLL